MHKLFCEYDLIILVRLCDPEIQNASSIADLLPCRDDVMANNIADKITARDGKNTLWILDGWDELPLDLQKSSLFWDMINASEIRKSPIAVSDIIVISRPISSSELQKVASARFEILGFTIKQQEGYFKECFEGDSAESECKTFLEIICNSPVLQSLCCLPQYAVYVVNLYLCEGDTSLSSEYEIFSAVIVNCVYRYFEKKDKVSLIEDVECLDDLSSNGTTKESFIALCQLAYCSIKKNKVSFSPGELPQNFNHLGLLQGVESLAARGRKLSYYFPNLSIQETLGTCHIATKLPDNEQSAEFKKLFHQPCFNAVFKFYAPKTQLKSPGIDKVLIDVIREMNIPKVISLLHCLHKAQNDMLCQHLAEELSGVLYLFGNPLNPVDSYAVGYLLSNICTSVRVHSGLTSVTGEFRVDLDNCQLGNQGCKSLVKGVRKYLSCEHAITSQAILELAGNMITGESILNCSLATFVLDSCEIEDGGIVSLANALEVGGTSIESLWLEDNPDITSRGLKEALSKNRSVEKVILPHQFARVMNETERELNKK